jgi:hypothetical protein
MQTVRRTSWISLFCLFVCIKTSIFSLLVLTSSLDASLSTAPLFYHTVCCCAVPLLRLVAAVAWTNILAHYARFRLPVRLNCPHEDEEKSFSKCTSGSEVENCQKGKRGAFMLPFRFQATGQEIRKNSFRFSSHYVTGLFMNTSFEDLNSVGQPARPSTGFP